MVASNDLITGRDALHRLDDRVENARDDHTTATAAAEAHKRRRSDIIKLRAEGYGELARLRLHDLKAGAVQALSLAEKEAANLLDGHDAFIATFDAEITAADAAVAEAEAARRAGEEAADAALDAYEAEVAKVEEAVQTDPAYVALRNAVDEARAVAARAAQKQDLAEADREQKGAPYQDDPLFSYLWERRFRTPEYEGKGMIRSMDGWVARVCGYDAAYLNYARLMELPDRLAEHQANMEREANAAEDAMEKFEADKLANSPAAPLKEKLDAARAALKAMDDALSAAEAKRRELRAQQEAAASGDSGPQGKARRLIEESLETASFPDLRVLAAETTTLNDDRIVDLLIKLRTEELQMEVNSRSIEALPTRRRAALEALEHARRRFKEAGLDSPYVAVGLGAFEAALDAWGRGLDADGEKLWRALAATVRQAPRSDDRYFGGPPRGKSIGLPDGAEEVAGAVLGMILREAMRGGGGGRWGGGGPWGGMGGGGSSRGSSGGFKTGGRIGGSGGFKTGGRIGGGGKFKTGGRI
jgi:hypothetical protein